MSGRIPSPRDARDRVIDFQTSTSLHLTEEMLVMGELRGYGGPGMRLDAWTGFFLAL